MEMPNGKRKRELRLSEVEVDMIVGMIVYATIVFAAVMVTAVLLRNTDEPTLRETRTMPIDRYAFAVATSDATEAIAGATDAMKRLQVTVAAFHRAVDPLGFEVASLGYPPTKHPRSRRLNKKLLQRARQRTAPLFRGAE